MKRIKPRVVKTALIKGSGAKVIIPPTPPVSPFIDLIDNRGWELFSSPHALLDLNKKRLGIPFGIQPLTNQIQVHELAHVKWTPRTYKSQVVKYLKDNTFSKQTKETIAEVAEDIRLNYLLDLVGAPANERILSDAAIEGLGYCRDFETVIIALAAAYKTSDYEPLKEAVSYGKAIKLDGQNHQIDLKGFEEGMEFAIGQRAKVAKSFCKGDVGEYINFTFTIAVSGFLASLLESPESCCTPLSNGSGEGEGEGSSGYSDGYSDDTSEDDDTAKGKDEFAQWVDYSLTNGHITEELLQQIIREVGQRSPEEYKDTKKTKVGISLLEETHYGKKWLWTKMKIETPDLPIPCSIQIKSKIRKTNDYGAVPVAFHRITSDNRVFDYRKKYPGGSVLIDHSSSMGLTIIEVEAILAQMPAATIGFYCGEDGGEKGILRIIAKDGKRVGQMDDLHSPYGGNGCDYPALLWLAEQEEPRYWVSDGQIVTGRCDDPDGGQRMVGLQSPAGLQCLTLCKAANITRVGKTSAIRTKFF